jgi:uncharacterized membrane protein
MKRQFVVAAAAVIVGVLSFASQSWAGFQVCNESRQQASVAIAHDSRHAGWVAEGWWTVAPHRCETVIGGRLHGRYYYVYAHGDRGGEWAARRGQRGGFFCVRHGRFSTHSEDFKSGNVINCERSGLMTRHFVVVDVHDAENFRYTLRR